MYQYPRAYARARTRLRTHAQGDNEGAIKAYTKCLELDAGNTSGLFGRVYRTRMHDVRTPARTHKQAHTHARTHARTHTRTYARTHAHTKRHKHQNNHTHARTHTHTHTCNFVDPSQGRATKAAISELATGIGVFEHGGTGFSKSLCQGGAGSCGHAGLGCRV